MRKCLICVGVLPAVLAFTFTHAAPATSRLAIVPVSETPDLLAVSELLTAELTKQPGIELVERAELERVLKEQKLSAAGLTDGAGSVELGKLLRAAGLVLVEQDPRRPFVMVRLLETQRGYRAGYWRYSTKDKTAPELVPTMAKDLVASVPKLGLSADKFTPVSVLLIRNATDLPEFAWLESELPEFFSAFLAQRPNLVVLERRQLHQVADEAARTAGDKLDLLGGALFVDGEVATALGVDIGGAAAKRRIVLRLRVRDPLLREVGHTEVEGLLGDLETVSAQAAAQLVGKLGELRPGAAGSTQTEAGVLVEIARHQDALWAAESATALSGDVPARQELVKSLLREFMKLEYARPDTGPVLVAQRPMPAEYALGEARLLARVADTCLAAGPEDALKIMKEAQGGAVNGPTDNYLLAVRTVSAEDPELRALLQPYRKLLRMVDEFKAKQSGPSAFSRIPYWYDDPLEAMVAVQAYLDPLTRDAGGDPVQRHARLLQATLGANFAQVPRTQAVPYLKRLAADPDPFVRFFGCFHLTQVLYDTPEEAVYAKQRAERLVDLLDYPGVFVNWHYGWGLSLLQGKSFSSFGDKRLRELWPAVHKKLRGYLEDRRYDAFLCLAPMSWPTPDPRVMPPGGEQWRNGPDRLKDETWQKLIADAIRTFQGHTGEELAATRNPNVTAAERLPVRTLDSLAKGFCGWRPRLQEHYPGFMSESAPAGTTPVKTVFASTNPVLAECLAELGRTNASVDASLEVYNMTRQGDTLWVELGDPWNNRNALGLAELDVSTGKIQSLRLSVFEDYDPPSEKLKAMEKEFEGTDPHMHPWCRWNDVFCLSHPAVGVILVRATGGADRRLLPVSRIGPAEGLPYSTVTALAGIGNDLYIAVPGRLLAWNQKTEKLTLLLDLSSDLQGGSLPRRSLIVGLIPAADGKGLYVLARYVYRAAQSNDQHLNLALWHYLPASKTWKELSPAVFPLNTGRGSLGETFERDVQFRLGLPLVLHQPGNGFAYLVSHRGHMSEPREPGFVLNPETGAFVTRYATPKISLRAPLLTADGQVRLVIGTETWEIRYDPTATEPPAPWPRPNK